MIVTGLVTDIENDPVPNGSEGEIRTLYDNVLVGTVTTTDGWFTWSQNGSPGLFKITWDDISTKVRVQYSKIVGPSGMTGVGDLPLLFRVFRDGVIADLSGEMAVTANGSNMQVSVALGGAISQGILYDQRTISSLTIDAAHATLSRIDTVVVETYGDALGDAKGRSLVRVVKGTAASSPVAPTLLNAPGAIVQMPLADVLVGPAVIVIGSDKVTDRRDFARTTIPENSITPTELNDDALALYALKESGTTKNSVPVNRLNFNGDDFNVTVNSGFDGKQIDIELADAGSGGTARATFMPISEFVATGTLSSGTRTLITLGVGPLPTSVPYAVMLFAGVTLRNSVNTGTVSVRCNIDGGTQRTHEFQNVGGVPRWAPVTQSAQVTKNPGASFNVTASIVYVSGDPTDVRAGHVSVIAFPASLLAV